MHTIKVAIFEGLDKTVFKDRREFELKQTKEGLILKQMEANDLLKKVSAGKNTRYYK